MIDFYDSLYMTPNRYTGVSAGGLWIFEAKTKAYKDTLKTVTSQLKDALTFRMQAYESLNPNIPADQLLINTHFGTYSTIKIWRDGLIADPLHYVFEGDAGLYSEEDDTNACVNWNAISDGSCSGVPILKMLFNRSKAKAVESPPAALGAGQAFSMKLTDFFDNFWRRFHDFYMFARQLNNFQCSFMPTFKALYVLMSGVKSGEVFGYFDTYMAELTESNTQRINDIYGFGSVGSPTKNATWYEIQTLVAGMYNDFLVEKSTVKNRMNTGITDFTEIINKAEDFLEGMSIGIKVISVSNIVLTANKSDNLMLKDMASSSVGIIDVDLIQPVDSSATRLRLQTFLDIRASAYTTEIALKMKDFIKKDFTNFEFILSKTITIGLTGTGVIKRLKAINDLIGIYGLPYSAIM